MADGTRRASGGRRLVEAKRTEGVAHGHETELLVDLITASRIQLRALQAHAEQGTHLTVLTAPPFSAHTWFPSLLMARETGNSPSLDTGVPICVICDGLVGLILNTDRVFEPGCGGGRVSSA